MASDLTGYFGNKILRWLSDQADMPTRPDKTYLAIFNGNPKTSGSEVGATVNPSAARQEVQWTTLADGVTHVITSTNAQDWGNAAAAAIISHIALFDDPTPGSGHMYASKAVNGGAQSVQVNSSVKFNVGATSFNVGSDS